MKRFLAVIPLIIQLIGTAILTYGAYLIYPQSAIVLGGSFLILFGIAMERRNK